MWLLWRKSTTYHKLPSEVFGEDDPLAAWMLDNAVTIFGTLIENALQERWDVGAVGAKQSIPRYTLPQLLDSKFRLPRPETEAMQEISQPVHGLLYDEVNQ